MEHAINVATGHVVKYLIPKGRPKTFHGSDHAESNDEDPDGNGDDNDDGVDDSVGDSDDALRKAFGLVKQVHVHFLLNDILDNSSQIRLSPQAQAFFRKMCWEVDLPELELTQWVRTCWVSLFKTLDRLLKLQPAVTHFIQLADDSDEVPTLKGKSYAGFRLGKRDWMQLTIIHEVLQVFFFLSFREQSLYLLNRNRPVPRKRFRVLHFQLSGTSSPCSNSYSKHGRTWPLSRNLLSLPQQSKQALPILASGITRQTKQTPTSFVLVRCLLDCSDLA